MVGSKRLPVAMTLVWLAIALAVPPPAVRAEQLERRTGTQWAPFVQWKLPNKSIDGNPFDLTAIVTFTHESSGESRQTAMFYVGDDRYAFRFAGTRAGQWTFVTKSSDPDLDGRRGAVTIQANEQTLGFVTGSGSKWARQAGDGRPRAFVPQYVMYGHPGTFHGQAEKIEADIRAFIHQHGFTGFHVPVYCRWFNIEHDRSSGIRSNDPNPDARTFEALELLITKVHAAGGAVHLWAWGDESRRQTPAKWGINGAADRRLQRYIAARLGPLPGWTMGYGFDLDEWVTEEQLGQWRDHMHQQLGWPHMLGGRHGDPNQGLDHSSAVSWNRRTDYASYEHHRPTYDVYVAALAAVPGKPAFSEDRFRIRQSRQYRSKDYTEEMTRRGLWHSAMAGGVANIWGRLDGDLEINMGRGASRPYDHPHWIKTCSKFFEHRFQLDSTPHNGLSDGLCLKRASGGQWLFYRQDAGSIQLDLSAAPGPQPAVAVDTKKPYQEIGLGRLAARQQTWQAPYPSDWAVAVGEFP